MYRLSSVLVGLILILTTRSASFAQADGQSGDAPSVVIASPPPPKTRLETAAVQKGVVVVGGYTDIGTVQGEEGAFVRITAAEFTSTANTAKEFGLLVTIHQSDASGRETRSYIDEDEIDSLIASLDAMTKIDRTMTDMTDFDARFRTRGELEVANVNIGGVRMVSLHGVQILYPSGQELWATARYPLARLSEITQYLSTGKMAIEKAKENNK